VTAHLTLPSSITNTAQQAYFFALPYKSTRAALNCKIQYLIVSQGQEAVHDSGR
jgi:hypothetical protein